MIVDDAGTQSQERDFRAAQVTQRTIAGQAAVDMQQRRRFVEDAAIEAAANASQP